MSFIVFLCFSISQSFISISAAIYWKIYRKPEKYVILSTLKIPIGDRIGKSTVATSKVNSSTWPKVKTTNKNFIQIKPYLKSLNLQKTKAPNLTHWDKTYCVCRHGWLDFDRLPTHVNVMSLNGTYMFSSPMMQQAERILTISVIMLVCLGSIARANNDKLRSSPKILCSPYYGHKRRQERI